METIVYIYYTTKLQTKSLTLRARGKRRSGREKKIIITLTKKTMIFTTQE